MCRQKRTFFYLVPTVKILRNTDLSGENIGGFLFSSLLSSQKIFTRASLLCCPRNTAVCSIVSREFHFSTMAPKVPSVNNCCCYFELRTGALILGWLDLVVSILGILGGVLSLFSGDSSEQERVVLVTESQQIVGETSVLQTIIQIVISAILLPLTVWFLKGIYEVS